MNHCILILLWQIILIQISFLNNSLAFSFIVIINLLILATFKSFVSKSQKWKPKLLYWSKTGIYTHPADEINCHILNMWFSVCSFISPQVRVSPMAVPRVLHYHSFPSCAPSDSTMPYMVQIRHKTHLHYSPFT